MMIQLSTAAGKTAETWAVFGEVVAVHIYQHFFVDGVYDTAAARPILRAGRLGDYAEIRKDMFEMTRPG